MNPVKMTLSTDQDMLYLTMKSESGCKVKLSVLFSEPGVVGPTNGLKLPKMPDRHNMLSIYSSDMPVV